MIVSVLPNDCTRVQAWPTTDAMQTGLRNYVDAAFAPCGRERKPRRPRLKADGVGGEPVFCADES